MLQIRFGTGTDDDRTPVRTRDGDRVGTVADADSRHRYVDLHADAPAVVCDALDCDPGADRVPLPDALVASAGDELRLVV